jgi:hypothetical protein
MAVDDTLWIDYDDDERGITVGPHGSAEEVFKEFEDLAPTFDSDYPELSWVPTLVSGDDIGMARLRRIQADARRFKADHYDRLSDRGRYIIDALLTPSGRYPEDDDPLWYEDPAWEGWGE